MKVKLRIRFCLCGPEVAGGTENKRKFLDFSTVANFPAIPRANEQIVFDSGDGVGFTSSIVRRVLWETPKGSTQRVLHPIIFLVDEEDSVEIDGDIETTVDERANKALADMKMANERGPFVWTKE